MKNVKALFLIALLSLMLVACSGEEELVMLEMDAEKYYSQVMYEAENDRIIKQTTLNEVTYDVLQVASKEEAKEAIQASMDEFSNLDGIEHHVQFEEDKLIEEIHIDYDILHIDEIDQVPGLPAKNEAGEVSLEASINLLESQGYKLMK